MGWILSAEIGAEGWVAIIGGISAGLCAVIGTAFAFLKWFIPFYYTQKEKSKKNKYAQELKVAEEYKSLLVSERSLKVKWEAQLDKQDARIDSLERENEKCRAEQQILRQELTKIKYKHERLSIRWRAMLKVGRGATIVARADGTIIKASPEITGILHWVPDDLEGENISVLIPKRLRRFHIEAITRVIEQGNESSDIKRIDSLAVRKEDAGKDNTYGKEIMVTILVNWFRVENGYGPYLMCADIFPRLPEEDDSDLGKTDEGPMKGLDKLPNGN